MGKVARFKFGEILEKPLSRTPVIEIISVDTNHIMRMTIDIPLDSTEENDGSGSGNPALYYKYRDAKLFPVNLAYPNEKMSAKLEKLSGSSANPDDNPHSLLILTIELTTKLPQSGSLTTSKE